MSSLKELTSRVAYGREEGAVGKGLLLWMVGVPLPIILILWLLGILS